MTLLGAIEAGGTKFVCGVGTGPHDLRVVRIPTNRRSARRNGGRRLFVSAEQKWQAVIETAAAAVGGAVRTHGVLVGAVRPR